VREPILERIGGNPLYAEEYVRLLLDRGLLLEAVGLLRLREGEELPLPDTVQAVLAARLDTLPPEQKALLCDAAVFGESFWCGGVAAIAERGREEVEQTMAALTERQLVRPVASSSLTDETEYMFWHALARDVAYGELPKRARAQKHVALAGWLELKLGERAEELAEVLAHHYVTALELAESVHDVLLGESLVEPALRYLGLAGRRARVLDLVVAERHFTRALELAPPQGAERPRLLAQWAMVVSASGRCRESIPAFQEAIAQLRAAGENRLAAEALIRLAVALQRLGRADAHAPVSEAIALLEGDEPSPEMIDVFSVASINESNRGRQECAKELAERALASAKLLGLSPRGRDMSGSHHCREALMARGLARCDLGDVGGLDDLREASEAVVAQGADPYPVVNNYAIEMQLLQGPVGALPVCRLCLELCRDRNFHIAELDARAMMVEVQFEGGAWDDALETSIGLIESLEAHEEAWSLVDLRSTLALLLARRGRRVEALRLVEWSLERARQMPVQNLLCSALVVASSAHASVDQGAALALLRELQGALDPSFAVYGVYRYPEMLRTAHLVGPQSLAEQLTNSMEPRVPTQHCSRGHGDALLAEARREYGDAAAGFADTAARWHEFGVPYEEAQALLGQGRCLVALRRAPDAAKPLTAAREVFTRLDAKPAFAEVDLLLGEIATTPH
jgi:tetratricopeptide (TPR) repeat protein